MQIAINVILLIKNHRRNIQQLLERFCCGFHTPCILGGIIKTATSHDFNVSSALSSETSSDSAVYREMLGISWAGDRTNALGDRGTGTLVLFSYAHVSPVPSVSLSLFPTLLNLPPHLADVTSPLAYLLSFFHKAFRCSLCT